MLKVQRLHTDAILPTCAHPGEDLGYDIYALEDAELVTGIPNKIRTGIAAVWEMPTHRVVQAFGLLIRDRSSMAANGVIVSGGVVDAGYRGEIVVILTYTVPAVDASGALCPHRFQIKKGQKIAQMLPIAVRTHNNPQTVSTCVHECESLPQSSRGEKGFGSSGQ